MFPVSVARDAKISVVYDYNRAQNELRKSHIYRKQKINFPDRAIKYPIQFRIYDKLNRNGNATDGRTWHIFYTSPWHACSLVKKIF